MRAIFTKAQQKPTYENQLKVCQLQNQCTIS